MAQLRVSELADGAVRGARRIRFRRWAVAISAIALVLGSAAAAAVLLTAPTTPLAPTASAPAAADRQGGARATAGYASSPDAAIYIAALRGRPTPGASLNFNGVYVESVRCRATDPATPCDLQPIPADVQADISAALPEVRFVTRVQAARLHGVELVRFGQITYSDGSAKRAFVPIGVHCGPLCGEGTTLILAQQQDASWKVVGTTGIGWIS